MGLSEENAKKLLGIAIDWGRYGELFDYDVGSGELILTEVFAALSQRDEGAASS